MRHQKLKMLTTAAGPSFRPVAIAGKSYEVPSELAGPWLELGYAVMAEPGARIEARLRLVDAGKEDDAAEEGWVGSVSAS